MDSESFENGQVRREVRFPETRWSLISEVQSQEEDQRERALSELCRIYWFPLYAFARAKGCDPNLAEDLTQDLFLRLLSNDSFAAARKDRGRLRNYLLTAMNRMMANDARRRSTLKRAPERVAISIERDLAEHRLGGFARSLGLSPEQEFDRRWAQALLQEVERQLGKEFEEQRRGEQFDVLKGYLLPGEAGATYAEAGEVLGLSEGAVKIAVFRMRKRFRAVLRDEIAHTVTENSTVEDELRHLYAALAG